METLQLLGLNIDGDNNPQKEFFIKDIIDCLTKIKTDLTAQIAPCDHSNKHLLDIYHEIKLLFSSPAKNIRPILILLCSKLIEKTSKINNDSKDQNKILVSVISEYIHCASLIHDDIIDDSSLRRGKQTVHKNIGNKSAILTGDLIYSRACELIATSGNIQLLQIFAHSINQMSKAELIQMNSLNTICSESTYFDIIYGKTAALIAASTASAALDLDQKLINLNENNHKKSKCDIFTDINTNHLPWYFKSNYKDYNYKYYVKILWKFGYFLGLSYQIIDDYLDYFGTAHHMKKNCFNDLYQARPTLALIDVFNRSDTKNKLKLKNIIKNPKINFDLNKKYLLELFEAFNTKKNCLELSRHYTNKAIQIINDNFEDSQAKTSLISLSTNLLKRIN